MKDFEPYANEADVLTVGNLSVENRLDRVTLQGDVELRKDRRGLALAKHLKAVIDATVKAPDGSTSHKNLVVTMERAVTKNPDKNGKWILTAIKPA